MVVLDGAPAEPTKDTIILETEKPQGDARKQPAAEAVAEDRVTVESCDRHIVVLLYYASSSSRNCRPCVMPITRTGYGLQVYRRFELTVIDSLLINYDIRAALPVYVSHSPTFLFASELL